MLTVLSSPTTTMTNLWTEKFIRISALLYGFIFVNSPKSVKLAQKLVIFCAIVFNIVLSIVTVYRYKENLSFESTSVSAQIGVNILGELWAVFSVIWGLVQQPKLKRSSILLLATRNQFRKLGKRSDFYGPQQILKIFSCLLVVANICRATLAFNQISLTNSQEILVFFEIVYKLGAFSVFNLYMTHLYHNIFLLFREINRQLTDYGQSPTRIASLASIHQTLCNILDLTNSFFALPVITNCIGARNRQ